MQICDRCRQAGAKRLLCGRGTSNRTSPIYAPAFSMSSRAWTEVVSKKHRKKNVVKVDPPPSQNNNDELLQQLLQEYHGQVEEVVVELLFLQNEGDYAKTKEQLDDLFQKAEHAADTASQNHLLEHEEQEVDSESADPVFSKFRKLFTKVQLDSETLQLMLDSMPGAPESEIINALKQIAGEPRSPRRSLPSAVGTSKVAPKRTMLEEFESGDEGDDEPLLNRRLERRKARSDADHQEARAPIAPVVGAIQPPALSSSPTDPTNVADILEFFKVIFPDYEESFISECLEHNAHNVVAAYDALQPVLDDPQAIQDTSDESEVEDPTGEHVSFELLTDEPVEGDDQHTPAAPATRVLDFDEKVSILREMFPKSNDEQRVDLLLEHDSDLAKTIDAMLKRELIKGAKRRPSQAVRESIGHANSSKQGKRVLTLGQFQQKPPPAGTAWGKPDEENQAAGLASQLKLQQLVARFPSFDEATLVEFFAANGHNFETTISILESRAPRQVNAEPARGSHTLSYGYNGNNKYLQAIKKKQSALPQTISSQRSGLSYIEQGEDYNAVLERAMAYKDMSIGCYKQAVMAFHMRCGDLAKQMSEKGRLYKLRSVQDFRKVAHLMCRDARTTIDLHGMHVESAVSLVDEFVSIYLEVGLSRGMRRFQIITGAGLHSRGGRAKLKPAIQGLLRNRGVHFYDVNSGTIEIVIR